MNTTDKQMQILAGQGSDEPQSGPALKEFLADGNVPSASLIVGSTAWLMSFMITFYDRNIEIMKRKNADYSAQSGNPFGNFMALENLASWDGTSEIGFITRMMDKFMRVISFAKNGELMVKDEGVEDTLADVANYAGLFAAYITWKKWRKESKAPTVSPSPSGPRSPLIPNSQNSEYL